MSSPLFEPSQLTRRKHGTSASAKNLCIEYFISVFYSPRGSSGKARKSVILARTMRSSLIQKAMRRLSRTCVKITLPIVEECPEAEAQSPVSPGVSQGDETIMLVEDREAVRELFGSSLRGAGYRVLEASGAEAALELSRSHNGPIDLLATDVVMPRRNGFELARQLSEQRPDMKVLYFSGYSSGTVESLPGGISEAEILRKPFSPNELIGRVRSHLR